MADVSYDRWELYYTRADDGIWVTDGTARICLGFDATVRDAMTAVAAGSERERVTALWREAAASLATERDLFEIAARDRDIAQDKLFAERARSRELEAECGRLREQLDALTEAVDAFVSDGSNPSKPSFARMLAARAALGVEGEQEKPT